MNDIYFWHDKTKIQLRTLRKLDKAGALNIDSAEGDIIYKIRSRLKKGNNLTAVDQLYLFRNSKELKRLAPWESELSDIMNALGDVRLDAATWREVAIHIYPASQKEAESAQIIACWVRKLLDRFPAGKTCDHPYVATRLMMNVPDHMLRDAGKEIAPCMLQVRKQGTLCGYWHINEKGQTAYHQRPVEQFDI